MVAGRFCHILKTTGIQPQKTHTVFQFYPSPNTKRVVAASVEVRGVLGFYGAKWLNSMGSLGVGWVGLGPGWGKYLSPGWSNYHRSPHVRCHVGATRPWVGGRWRRCVIERDETSKLSQKSSLPSYKLQVTHDNLVLELKLSLCFVCRLCLVQHKI